MTDEHGNSFNRTSEDAGQSQIVITQEAPTVRFYKVNIDSASTEVLDNAFMGLSDGTIGLPAGTIDNSILSHFQTETFTTNTSGIVVTAGSNTGTLKFIDQINLDTISDISSAFGNDNGISQLGTISLNNERLIIVFPTSITDTPNTMVDILPLTDVTDTYFLYAISSNELGGSAVLSSNIISFTRTVDNLNYKMINLENPKTGNYKFYLLPDENNTNLPTS